ncbi:MAG: tetratricopeptide repeat protein [Ignavibacteria bacterium]|nr:tetratricopeptide repeat protein [Ignavibacteria bacterium]
MGSYEKAEPAYLESNRIVKEVFGERHPYYATSLNNLATFYYAIGDHVKKSN